MAAMCVNLLCLFLELLHVIRLPEVFQPRQFVFALEFSIFLRVASSSVYQEGPISFGLASSFLPHGNSVTLAALTLSFSSHFLYPHIYVDHNRPALLVFLLNSEIGFPSSG